MDFKLTEEQKEIKRAAREFAEKEFTPELALEYDQKEEFPMDALQEGSPKLDLQACEYQQEYDGQGYGVSRRMHSC
jgi:acyl-CoA dehydrogenase